MKFVYCAYGGQKYAAQLAQSVRSVRQQHPQAQIVVYTVADFLPFLRDLPVESQVMPQAARRSDWHDPFMKVRAVQHAAGVGQPFVYLDNDTYVAAPLDEAWALLEHADCMGVHSPIPDQRGFLGLEPAPGLSRPDPQVFPEWNGGVLFFAASAGARRVLDRWLQVLEMGIPGGGDQWPLAQALWDSQARLHVLPGTYNCRLPATPVVMGEICVLHDDHPQLPEIAEVLNAQMGLRQVVMTPQGYDLAPAGTDGRRMF